MTESRMNELRKAHLVSAMSTDAGHGDNAAAGVLLDHLSPSGLGGEEYPVDVDIVNLVREGVDSKHLL